MSSFVGLYVKISQTDLDQEYGVKIKKKLATKFSALKIAFPEQKFQALETLNLRDYGDQHTITDFADLSNEEMEKLAKVGITIEKIKHVAQLANYYAEKHYLGRNDSKKELELEELCNQEIQFTVVASVRDPDQARNLAFNQDWQKYSTKWA